jgi:hypothetical protein
MALGPRLARSAGFLAGAPYLTVFIDTPLSCGERGENFKKEERFVV